MKDSMIALPTEGTARELLTALVSEGYQHPMSFVLNWHPETESYYLSIMPLGY